MSKTVSLLFGVHGHQPVGNFSEVLDDSHLSCYGPFLRVMYEYPEFRFSVHFSGWLLDYLLQHYPEDMALLKEMVARDQAELFGAGYTEPVLAAIPEIDRIGQINQLSQYLKHHLGHMPRGAWLTERVWESSVVPALADSGIRYVIVDDYHLLCTGKPAASLNGYYTTEENGRQVDLFPISEQLRYQLPFSPVDEAVAYLESLADDTRHASAIYFDDIEKFGVWPGTHAWVFEQGWLRSFIEAVLASRSIKPLRFCDYHAMARTSGMVYLPSCSYIEMNQWSLPMPAAGQYAALSGAQQHYQDSKPFVRGGIWRNFLMRYPEANWMHKRMLALSARYHALPEYKKSNAMLVALYETQANDAYWHGMFGGLYLPHLRRAIYQAIIKLEYMLDEVTPRAAKVLVDLDLDGCDEAFLQNGVLQAVARLDGSAVLCEFDSYKLQHNFADTLTLQPELYHQHVLAHQQTPVQEPEHGLANPHQRMATKDTIVAADLVPDSYRKGLFCDFFVNHKQAEAIQYQRPIAGKSNLDFYASHQGGEVHKKFALIGNNLLVRYDFAHLPAGSFRVEVNLAMPSCAGPAGRFRVGTDILGGFGQPLKLTSLKHLALEDEVLGGAIHLFSSVPCKLACHPHFSVSQSEAGFEKIMQALTLVLEWPAKALTHGVELKLEVI